MGVPVTESPLFINDCFEKAVLLPTQWENTIGECNESQRDDKPASVEYMS